MQNGPGLSVFQFHLSNQLVHFAQNVNDSPVIAVDSLLQGVDLLVQMFRNLQGADLSIFKFQNLNILRLRQIEAKLPALLGRNEFGCWSSFSVDCSVPTESN